MIALTIADWPLSRRLLLEQRLQVDMLETTGFLAEQAAAQFPQLRCSCTTVSTVGHWASRTRSGNRMSFPARCTCSR